MERVKQYCVLDLETSGEKTYKRFCNPLDARHSVTLAAYKMQGESASCIYNERDFKLGLDRDLIFLEDRSKRISFLVGQNFKFDMLWFWGESKFQKWIKEGGKIWDTLTVEYLLTGQSSTKKDLDTLAKKYGGTVKDDRVKVMFENGLKSNEIDPSMLIPYALEDVNNTEIVLKKQAKQARQLGMMPLIRCYMDHYLAVTEMEYNGLYIDKELLEKKQKKLEGEIGQLTSELKKIVGDPEFNPASPQQVSKYLFGDIRSVAEKVLKEYKTNQEFITQLLELRKKRKVLGTYLYTEEVYLRDNKERGIKKGDLKRVTGLKPLIMSDGCVHTEYRTAFTRTGRLSSGEPNVQNLPPEVRDLVCSRWGLEGCIVCFDYSQLEVIVQAYLTQAPNFIRDICEGVDFHCKRLAYAEGIKYEEAVNYCKTDSEWQQKRKRAKIISFQKAYGARPEKIAKESKLPLAKVQQVFQREDEEYPEISLFYKLVLESVERSRKPTKDLIRIRDKKANKMIKLEGEYAAIGTYQSLNGKLYSFEEKAVLTKRGTVFRWWNMPDIQDYPVQGMAADIVATQVGKVFRFLVHHRDKVLMINEVHDELVLDVKKEYLDWTIKNVKSILEDVKTSFKENWGLEFNVPIKVEVGYGLTWKDAK